MNRTMPPPPADSWKPEHASASVKFGNENGDVSSSDAEAILNVCLKAEHRRDPNVLKYIAAFMRSRDNAQASRECKLPPHHGNYLRNRPDIHAAIVELSKAVVVPEVDGAEIVMRVKEIGVIDPIEYFKDDGSFKDIRDIAPEARRAIKKIKFKNCYEKDPNGMPIVTGQIIDLEFHDKMKAQELLGREAQRFVEKKVVEHGVTKEMGRILLGGLARADEKRKELAAAAQAEPILIEARRVESDGQ